MPRNKHKRKHSAHSKPKTVKNTKPSGLIAKHPKAFVLLGLCFVALGVYLLVFKSQYNAMLGMAMVSIVVGMVIAAFANFAVPKKNKS